MATKLISAEGIGFRAFGFPVTINWFHFLLPALWVSGIDFANLRPGVSAAGIVVYEGYRQLGMLEEKKPPENQMVVERLQQFDQAGRLPGKLFIPTGGKAKKHPCPDCFDCQWCSDTRCEACGGWKKCKTDE